MKSFYTYDTRENKMLITVFNVFIAFSAIGTVGFVVSAILLIHNMLKMIIFTLLFGVFLSMLLATLPARKRYLKRLQEETIVAHDWGIEHQVGIEKREVKWDQIQGIDVIDRSFILWKMNQYVVSISGDRPIDFYSNLENADFLVNHIKKNLKKRSDDLDVKWVK
ncbi:MAG: hypothetical protein AB2L14_18500 [Candidatus Xenobiia bacterium LiM19]